MGTAITSLLKIKETSIKELSGKTLVIDGQNMLYQFLTTIRQQDGSLLTDKNGNVTSHLIGLISRLTNFLQNNLKIIFVFDGKVPDLKKQELQKRKEVKISAQEKYETAKAKENIADMKKYASRTTRLTPDLLEEAKVLIDAIGLPIVQAPSEGEAQAARIVANGDAYAIVSQDADSLLFGATRVVRNLNIAGKRKMGATYKKVYPEIIELSETLNHLQIDRKKLILLAMLVGTDYNVGGIKGIGPKTAISLVKKYDKPEELFEEVKWFNHFTVDWKDVYDALINVAVIDDYSLEWKPFDKEKIRAILVDKHDFSEERMARLFEKLEKTAELNKQKSIFDY